MLAPTLGPLVDRDVKGDHPLTPEAVIPSMK